LLAWLLWFTPGRMILVGGWERRRREARRQGTLVEAAPEMPEMKFSQILPMVAMMALQKFDLEALGYVHHVEVAYVIIQIVSLGVLYLTYTKICQMGDDGVKIKIPEVKQMGQVVSPAKEQTAKEYDMEKWKEAIKQPLISCVISGGIYYKWGSLLPLVMQALMVPLQLYEAPLTQIHILGKVKSRPFPVASMFGLPSAPAEPQAEAEAEEKPVQDKKGSKKAVEGKKSK